MRNEKEITIHAPYNFVPFAFEGPLRRYDSPRELPGHDCMDASLHTGEIHITLTAKSPIYISDGNNRFFRDGNGNYAIPGSTIRGMTRQNVQILGLGLMRPGEDFENRRLFYRKIGSAKDDVAKELSRYYKTVLNVTREWGDNYPRPHNIKAGYLAKDSEGYYIIPTK